jgi:hypothetical protein
MIEDEAGGGLDVLLVAGGACPVLTPGTLKRQEELLTGYSPLLEDILEAGKAEC